MRERESLQAVKFNILRDKIKENVWVSHEATGSRRAGEINAAYFLIENIVYGSLKLNYNQIWPQEPCLNVPKTVHMFFGAGLCSLSSRLSKFLSLTFPNPLFYPFSLPPGCCSRLQSRWSLNLYPRQPRSQKIQRAANSNVVNCLFSGKLVLFSPFTAFFIKQICWNSLSLHSFDSPCCWN